jgi:hypothetical protein
MALTPQSLKDSAHRRGHAYFAHWNPTQYLSHYYRRVESEEHHTLRFIASQARPLAPNSVALEFGIGPTLHHVLPLAASAAELHVADLLPANLQSIRDWQLHSPTAHNWNAFTRVVLINEGVAAPTPHQIAHRENLARSKITRYLLANADCAHPAGTETARRYDCVLSCYCADSATASRRHWFRMMRNIAGMVAPAGRIVIAALRRCSYYKVGGIQFPSADIDEQDMLTALRAMNCDPSTLELQVEAVPDRNELGFDGIILAAARLR